MTPHEITDACVQVHCHIHHVDEPDDGAYEVCGECGHVYRSARELRRAWRAGEKAAHRALGSGLPWWRRGWRRATVRASRIGFCQHCLHDFVWGPRRWTAYPDGTGEKQEEEA